MLSNFRRVSAEWEQQHYPEPPMDESRIPTVDLKYCEFDKNRKVLKLASEYFGMPSQFFVRSHHTGRKILFTPVRHGDPLCDEDGWDGEMQIYRPVTDLPNVDHMYIYHAW